MLGCGDSLHASCAGAQVDLICTLNGLAVACLQKIIDSPLDDIQWADTQVCTQASASFLCLGLELIVLRVRG